MSKVKLKTLTQKAVEAMNVAIQGVVDDHRRRNQPLAVWKDGKVVLIHPGATLAVREESRDYGTKHH
jgi:hypothetical protein